MDENGVEEIVERCCASNCSKTTVLHEPETTQAAAVLHQHKDFVGLCLFMESPDSQFVSTASSASHRELWAGASCGENKL